MKITTALISLAAVLTVSLASIRDGDAPPTDGVYDSGDDEANGYPTADEPLDLRTHSREPHDNFGDDSGATNDATIGPNRHHSPQPCADQISGEQVAPSSPVASRRSPSPPNINWNDVLKGVTFILHKVNNHLPKSTSRPAPNASATRGPEAACGLRVNITKPLPQPTVYPSAPYSSGAYPINAVLQHVNLPSEDSVLRALTLGYQPNTIGGGPSTMDVNTSHHAKLLATTARQKSLVAQPLRQSNFQNEADAARQMVMRNQMIMQNEAARQLMAQNEAARQMMAQNEAVRQMMAQTGPARQMMAQTGPARQMMVQTGPARQMMVQTGPARQITVHTEAVRQLLAQNEAARQLMAQNEAARQMAQTGPAQHAKLQAEAVSVGRTTINPKLLAEPSRQTKSLAEATATSQTKSLAEATSQTKSRAKATTRAKARAERNAAISGDNKKHSPVPITTSPKATSSAVKKTARRRKATGEPGDKPQKKVAKDDDLPANYGANQPLDRNISNMRRMARNPVFIMPKPGMRELPPHTPQRPTATITSIRNSPQRPTATITSIRNSPQRPTATITSIRNSPPHTLQRPIKLEPPETPPLIIASSNESPPLTPETPPLTIASPNESPPDTPETPPLTIASPCESPSDDSGSSSG